jgi:hypothetical protein
MSGRKPWHAPVITRRYLSPLSFRAWIALCVLCTFLGIVYGWAGRVLVQLYFDTQIQQNHGDIATSIPGTPAQGSQK